MTPIQYDRKETKGYSLPGSYHNRLSKEAEKRTFETGEFVSASEIMRRALDLYWNHVPDNVLKVAQPQN